LAKNLGACRWSVHHADIDLRDEVRLGASSGLGVSTAPLKISAVTQSRICTISHAGKENAITKMRNGFRNRTEFPLSFEPLSPAQMLPVRARGRVQWVAAAGIQTLAQPVEKTNPDRCAV